eukprot:15460116-Alexandrium_andersonii.AAC.1
MAGAPPNAGGVRASADMPGGCSVGLTAPGAAPRFRAPEARAETSTSEGGSMLLPTARGAGGMATPRDCRGQPCSHGYARQAR